MSERRNDIASKLSFVILTFLIGLVLTIFFTKTYDTAVGAMELSTRNEKDIAVIQEYLKGQGCIIEKMDKKLDKLLDAK